METWKDITFTGGAYQVSDCGNVRRVKYGLRKRRMIAPSIQYIQGYRFVNLCFNKNSKLCKVSRLVAEAFITNTENKPQVNHIDGNKQNDNVANLEWVTPKENIQHAWRTGLSKPHHTSPGPSPFKGISRGPNLLTRGELNYGCKLSDKQVECIVAEYNNGICQPELSLKYSVHQGYISRLVNKQRRVQCQ